MFPFLAMISKCIIFVISYLSSNTAFPKPLTPAEEEKYMTKYKNEGDREALKILIEHNMRLVAYIAKKYSCAHDSDDLISIGSIGLIKAIYTFDNSKKIALATYASRCIENEMLMVIRSLKKSKDDVSLETTCVNTHGDGQNIPLINTLKSNDDEIDEKIDANIFMETLHKSILNELEMKERQIIILRYGLDGEVPYTQREIAKKLNISRSYVSRIEKRAIIKIKDRITAQNN